MQNSIENIANEGLMSTLSAASKAVSAVKDNPRIRNTVKKAGTLTVDAMPGIAAYKEYKKGNYKNAAGELAFDVATHAPYLPGLHAALPLSWGVWGARHLYHMHKMRQQGPGQTQMQQATAAEGGNKNKTTRQLKIIKTAVKEYKAKRSQT
jgi:hypothetical protein